MKWLVTLAALALAACNSGSEAIAERRVERGTILRVTAWERERRSKIVVEAHQHLLVHTPDGDDWMEVRERTHLAEGQDVMAAYDVVMADEGDAIDHIHVRCVTPLTAPDDCGAAHAPE